MRKKKQCHFVMSESLINAFQVSLLIRVRCPPDTQGIILLLCASLWNFSQCFCALLCVAKVRWKFQTVFGVWYTLQTYIKITHSSGPCHYLVYANNGRDCRLAKIFLGANDVRQHSPGGPRFFPLEGRSGCWIFSVPNLFP
jgi:hypothetical protein